MLIVYNGKIKKVFRKINPSNIKYSFEHWGVILSLFNVNSYNIDVAKVLGPLSSIYVSFIDKLLTKLTPGPVIAP